MTLWHSTNLALRNTKRDAIDMDMVELVVFEGQLVSQARTANQGKWIDSKRGDVRLHVGVDPFYACCDFLLEHLEGYLYVDHV